MKLSVLWLPPLVLGLLLSLSLVSRASAQTSTAAVDAIQSKVVPAVTWATNWGTKVGFGLVGGQLFYTIVIRLVKD